MAGAGMTRTCFDCSAPISRQSKGRCRPCGMAMVNRTPEKRQLVAAAMRARRADPVFEAKMEAARPIAHARTKATRLAWCPRQHWETNEYLRRRGIKLEERKRLIADTVKHEGKRAVAAQVLKMQRKHEREMREAY